MAHPYPPHLRGFPYLGKCRYSLCFRTHGSASVFTDAANVRLVLAQFLRAGVEQAFEISAYCFMPDHVHLLVEGLTDASDCRTFIKAAKQYSGYYFKRATQQRLWQRYGYEHVLRDDTERATTIRYILDNPVTAGLASEPADYAFTGSECFTIDELLQQAAPRS